MFAFQVLKVKAKVNVQKKLAKATETAFISWLGGDVDL